MRGFGAGQVLDMAFQDFPLRAISILANSSLLGLGIPGPIIYIVY